MPRTLPSVRRGTESPQLRTTNFPEKVKQSDPQGGRRSLSCSHGARPVGSSPEASFTADTFFPHPPWARPPDHSPRTLRAAVHRPAFPFPTLAPPCPQAAGAAYRAVGRAGAHFVPTSVPAHLEDAAGASVAVHETPTLQSKAAVTSRYVCAVHGRASTSHCSGQAPETLVHWDITHSPSLEFPDTHKFRRFSANFLVAADPASQTSYLWEST